MTSQLTTASVISAESAPSPSSERLRLRYVALALTANRAAADPRQILVMTVLVDSDQGDRVNDDRAEGYRRGNDQGHRNSHTWFIPRLPCPQERSDPAQGDAVHSASLSFQPPPSALYRLTTAID
jgi:hypothetical protein